MTCGADQLGKADRSRLVQESFFIPHRVPDRQLQKAQVGHWCPGLRK